MKISDNVKSVWNSLSRDYATRGKATDSLDVLLDFPAQLKAVGDFKGKTILDLGSGVGDKSHYFASNGATKVVAVDIADKFVKMASEKFRSENLEFICGDLRDISEIKEIQGLRFDIITCFQAISFSDDLGLTFSKIAEQLAPNGKFIVTFPSPIRFAVEKHERFGIPLAKAYLQSGLYSYPASWNSKLTMEHYVYRFSDILNAFASAGLHLISCDEPELDQPARERYPHKAEWVDKFGGIIVYQLQKLSHQERMHDRAREL